MTTEQVLKAVVALLDPYATDPERQHAAEPLLDLLPDLGEAVKDRLNCQNPMINGGSSRTVDERIAAIYAAYGIEGN